MVIQRYGAEVIGGAEMLCRVVAERLSSRYDIEILTTCALDYTTWANHYPAGRTDLNGVAIRRFPSEHPRQRAHFEDLERQIFWQAHPRDLEVELLKAQGPFCPDLIAFLRQNHHRYDAIVFYTYLYYSTIFGLPAAGANTVLVPTAHDEPMFYLNILDELFAADLRPQLVFLSEEEAYLVRRRFCLPHDEGVVAGIGLDAPLDASPDEEWRKIEGELRGRRWLSYLGRIEEGKGCGRMIEFFLRAISDLRLEDVALLLMGKAAMPIPEHPAILVPGFVSENTKALALRGSAFSVAPSPHESLCIALLESWQHGRPAVVNADCDVLVGHCIRANGGLWYRSYEEFREILRLLLHDPSLAADLGLQGRRYVEARCSWPYVERQYLSMIEAAMGKSSAETLATRRAETAAPPAG